VVGVDGFDVTGAGKDEETEKRGKRLNSMHARLRKGA
jgi:hypothetical protein